MYSGLLSGAMTRARIEQFAADDWRRRNPNFQEPFLSRNLRLVQLLREIGDRYGRTPGEVAIAWTLHNFAVTAAIVGVRTREQVRGIIGAGEFRLDTFEAAQIDLALRNEAVVA
jgi:aryl-alcohol dehydrogenase-like predicted oxidoreductase